MNLRPVLLACLMLVGLNACSAPPAPKNIPSPPSPTKRALLIGVDKYPFVNQLNGCVNDVRAMKLLLTSKFGFPALQVKTLEDEGATRKAILDGLHELVNVTQAGDVVVIHYSGHGSQIADHSGAEVDGLDETIIPYDYHNVQGGAYPITDKQIAGALKALSAKTKNITVVLDCCHSGGGTKALEFGLRVITKDTREALRNDDFITTERSAITAAPLKDDHSAYVLLAGCRSDQVSYEVGIAAGQYHGIFTYNLVNVLQRSTGQMTWQEVMEAVKTQVRQAHDDQSPQLEGLNKNSFVFGDVYDQKQAYITAQPAGGNLIKLDGGQIYGFTVGSTFDVYPKGTLVFGAGKVATVEITKVSGFSSEAKVISGRVTDANSRAIEKVHVFGASALLVRFKGFDGAAAAAIKNNILGINGINAENIHPDLTFHKKGDKLLLFAGKDTTGELETVDLQGDNTARVKAAATAWVNWFRVAKVSNQNPGLPISVEVKLDPAEKAINLDQADYVFKDKTKAILVIKNKSKVPLFISVVDLQDNTDIGVFTLSQFKDPGNSSNQPLPPDSTFTAPFTVENISQKKLSRDIMKVIAATTDMNFDIFKQTRGAASRIIHPGDPLKTTAQWTSVDRVIFAEK